MECLNRSKTLWYQKKRKTPQVKEEEHVSDQSCCQLKVFKVSGTDILIRTEKY